MAGVPSPASNTGPGSPARHPGPARKSGSQPSQCHNETVLRAVAELLSWLGLGCGPAGCFLGGPGMRAACGPGSLASAGQAGQGLGGEVAGGEGLEQVVDGAGEGPL